MKLFDVYPLYDIEPVTANGCWLTDKKGEKYLDFYGGHAVISIGHSHPHFLDKITHQLSKLTFYSNSVQNGLQEELAEKLGRLSKCEEYRLFLCNSGAEAIENALKLASFHTGKKKVIAFDKAFHGRTSAAVNITDNHKIKAPLNATFPVEFLPFNAIDQIESELKKGDVAAIIIEGIQGVGGIHVPDAGFLQKLRALTERYGAVLILDEIQAGYGRSGHFFSFQKSGIKPDLVTVAKGMGNGFPIAGVLINPEFEASHGLLGTTFGGNHLACAAGIAVLDVLEKEKLIENAEKLGQILVKELKSISQLKEVRGMGLMIGIDLGQASAGIRKKLLMEGKIFTGSSSDPNVIRLLPPLNIGEAEINLFLQKFKEYVI